MIPWTRRNIDSEDIGVMLLQRTTVFFVVLIAVLVLAYVLYFTAEVALFRLLALPAYTAIGASLAGRIFRRSWKITRSPYYQRPPSYATEWNTRHDSAMQRSLDDYSFVEGEFHVSSNNGTKPSILPIRESDRMFPRSSLQGKEAPTVPEYGSSPSVIPMDNATLHSNAALQAAAIQQAPAFPIESHQDLQSRHTYTHRGNSAGTASRTVLPFGAKEALKTSKGRHRRPHTDPTQNKRSKAFMESEKALNDPGEGASLQSDCPSKTCTASEELQLPIRTGATVTSLNSSDYPNDTKDNNEVIALSPPDRDDLIRMPSRSRLWLDSSAERARMEAAAAQVHSPPTSNATYASSNKRVILASANVAGQQLNDYHTDGNRMDTPFSAMSPFTSEHDRDSLPHTPPKPTGISRSSFLASPAIFSSGGTRNKDRSAYDFDAIRQSLSANEQWNIQQERTVQSNRRQGSRRASLSLPSSTNHEEHWGAREGSDGHSNGLLTGLRLQMHESPSWPETRSSRPRTAPDEGPKRSSPDPEIYRTIDPLAAFLDVVGAENERIGREADDRPRTSRGGSRGAFGSPLEPSTTDNRPTTSDGSRGPLKPFGWQPDPPVVSAIDEQYRQLAAYVDDVSPADNLRGHPPLSRVESRSTTEDLL